MTTNPPVPAGVGRDRDAAGRARSDRPRDELGRPLPYGSVGVPRQPEGIVRTPQATVDEAQALLDAGSPFHAHEVFEDAWKATTGPDRALWKALAQLAVGLTHRARGNARGSAVLFARATAALRSFPPAEIDHPGPDVDVPGLLTWLDEVTAGRPPGRLRLRRADGAAQDAGG